MAYMNNDIHRVLYIMVAVAHGKESACSVGAAGDTGSIPGLRRS